MPNPSGFKFLEALCEGRNNSVVRYPVQVDTCASDWKVDNTRHTFSVGRQHAAGIRSDGSIVTWGGCGSSNGMLGMRSITGVPASANIGTGWATLSAGTCFTTGIKTDGTLWGWGLNCKGVLGNGFGSINDTTIISPVQVGTSTTWANGDSQSSASERVSAAIKTDGTLWVWGSCGFGALTNFPSTSSPIQTVAGGTGWTQVTVSGCSVMAICNGTLWGWGQNANGSLGNNNTGTQLSPVQTVAGGTNWCAVTSGNFSSYSSCITVAGLKTDGTLWLWGANVNGALGINNVASRSSPVQTIAGGTTWSKVSVGRYLSSTVAAIKTDGTLWLWGANNYSKLGNNINSTTLPAVSSPVQTIAGGTNWCAVSAGFRHTTAIKTDGTLWSWGKANSLGINCNSTYISRSSPVQTISGGTSWSKVCTSACGATHAIKTDGTLWVWGEGQPSDLGNNVPYSTCSAWPTPLVLTPTQLGSSTNWANINGGLMATTTTNALWTWGCNYSGRTSCAPINCTPFTSSPIQTIAGGTNWSQVSAGEEMVAAIKTDGTLWLWGSSGCGCGSLGDGRCFVATSSPVQTISGGTNWKQVCVQLKSTRPVVGAVKTDGTMWLWGCNACCTPSQTSAMCPTLFRATGFSGSASWSCISISNCVNALRTDNSLWKQYSPVYVNASLALVMPGTNWRTVHSGFCNNAAIKTDGTLWMWGKGGGSYGVCPGLGNPACTCNAVSPVQLSGTTWVDVSFNCFGFNGLKSDGTLWGWGGINAYDAACRTFLQALPAYCGIAASTVPTTRTVDFDDVFVRRDIFSEGGLWGWGSNGAGNLGDNTTTGRSSPAQTVAGGSNWKQADINEGGGGTNFAGAIKGDGTLWMWGCGTHGRLGTDDLIGRSSPVQTIAGGTNWKQVAVGGYQAAAIKTDGTLWTWGRNARGVLGQNLSSYSICGRSSPVQTIAGGTNWKQVATGQQDIIAGIKTDGTLWVWGSNYYGHLGINVAGGAGGGDRSSPVQTIAGGTNWKQVNTSVGVSAAIKTDGTLWTWGRGAAGVLGNNFSTNRSSPVQTIAGGTNWKQVSVGDMVLGAIKNDGTLWMWGCSANAVLGDGLAIDRSSPVQTAVGGNDWKVVRAGTSSMALKTNGSLWSWGTIFDSNFSGSGISCPIQRFSGSVWLDVDGNGGGKLGIRYGCCSW